jgi:hypothetical protein
MVKHRELIFKPSLSGKRGIAVYRDDYVRVKACILESLIDRNDMLLTELLQIIRVKQIENIVGDIGWLVLLVKADLQREGILKHRRSSPGERLPNLQVVSLRKARKEYIRLTGLTTDAGGAR